MNEKRDERFDKINAKMETLTKEVYEATETLKKKDDEAQAKINENIAKAKAKSEELKKDAESRADALVGEIADDLRCAAGVARAAGRDEQHEVEKNNGLVLHSVTVRPEDSNIAPNLYMDKFFERYEEGASIDDLMDEIRDIVVKNLDVPKEFSNVAEEFNHFESIKDKIVMVAVNTERNDNLISHDTVSVFTKEIGATLTVMKNGEHWFHTEEQMLFLDNWILRFQ